MYSIYDTREPEGNGGAIMNADGEAANMFETHADAELYAREHFGIDADRMIIAGSPEWYCDIVLRPRFWKRTYWNDGTVSVGKVCNTRLTDETSPCPNTRQHAE